MNLSRRKAMGIALGGAIVGPNIVKQAAQQIISTPPYVYQNIEAQCGKIVSAATSNDYLKDKLLQEKNYLMKLISGEVADPYSDTRNQKREILQHNIESLKSVSKANKLIFYSKEVDKRYIQERIEEAKKRLPEVLKELVGL